MNKSSRKHALSMWNEGHHDSCKKSENLKHLVEVAFRMHEESKVHGLPFRIVIGAITTGGFGFERNMFIFRRCIELLDSRGRQQGFLVFNQLPFQDAMIRILKLDRSRADEVGKTIPYPQMLMDEFYAPLFEAARFDIVHPLPKADQSTGARQEMEYCKKHNIALFPYPADLYEIAYAEMEIHFPG